MDKIKKEFYKQNGWLRIKHIDVDAMWQGVEQLINWAKIDENKKLIGLVKPGFYWVAVSKDILQKRIDELEKTR